MRDWRKRHPHYSQERSRRLRKFFIEMLGGKCQNPNCACPDGYSRCIEALEFHHPDGKWREHKAEWRFKAKFLQKIKEGKVKLFCANCHNEKHYCNEVHEK